MTQFTAWILALTLTGSPVMPGVCASVCGHGPAPTAHCHEELTEATQAAVSAESICGSAITDAAYVYDRTTPPQNAALLPSTASIPALTIPAGVSRLLIVPLAVGWLALPLVLRL
jgi:hypothetical protein